MAKTLQHLKIIRLNYFRALQIDFRHLILQSRSLTWQVGGFKHCANIRFCKRGRGGHLMSSGKTPKSELYTHQGTGNMRGCLSLINCSITMITSRGLRFMVIICSKETKLINHSWCEAARLLTVLLSLSSSAANDEQIFHRSVLSSGWYELEKGIFPLNRINVPPDFQCPTK